MWEREDKRVRIVEPDEEAEETTKSRFWESSGRGPKVGKYREEFKEEKKKD